IAEAFSNYEYMGRNRAEYNKLMEYNPYGPATPAIITTEEGLNLGNLEERTCAMAQLKNIKSYCPNCTVALIADEMDEPAVKAILESNTGIIVLNHADRAPETIASREYKDIVGLIAQSAILNDYNVACNASKVWKIKEEFASKMVQEYGVPSIILDFGVAEEGCWTKEVVWKMYGELYDKEITQLAGAGIIGIAQRCLSDNNCYPYDARGFGLIDSTGTNKNPGFETWFDKCGKYYYGMEGAAMTIFSADDKNGVCDGSKIMSLYNDYKCLAK
ncbi:MAG: hypothetical protein ABIH99_03435, partial [Candidatus Micrarchaeota archaeon]